MGFTVYGTKIVFIKKVSKLLRLYGTFLGPEDSAETLGFLPPRASVRRDLNEDVRFREIEAVVGDLGHEDCVDLGVVLEVLQDLQPLALGGGAVQVGPRTKM